MGGRSLTERCHKFHQDKGLGQDYENSSKTSYYKTLTCLWSGANVNVYVSMVFTLLFSVYAVIHGTFFPSDVTEG